MLADIQQEALRIVEVGTAQNIPLRLLGGLAIRLRCPHAAHGALARTYPDIDLAALPRQGQAVETLLRKLGYTPNKSFNLLNGNTRLLFYDQTHNRQVDVFVGTFSMCHRLPLAERLTIDPLTLPLAELLLTKLQIVQINEKDLRDVAALLLDHAVAGDDGETINVVRIAELCSKDWGWWKTITVNLGKLRSFAAAQELGDDAKHTVTTRIDELVAALDAAPKSLRWKTRAAIGERLPWYEVPEEVDRA